MKNHPLFPDKPDADVTGIHVTRFEQGAMTWAAERFAPEDLLDLAQVLDRFGGGLFELIAHGQGAGDGEDGKGKGKPKPGIVAREKYRLDGVPKPLNPSAAAPPAHAPTNGHASGSGGASDLVGILLQQAGEDRRMMMQLMGQMAQRPPPAPAPSGDSSALQIMASVLQNQGQIIAAALSRPPGNPAAPATGAAADPIKLVLDVIEMTNGLRAGAAEAIAGRAGTGELDLGMLADGADKVIEVIRKAKDLAEKGASPEEAAAAAAAAAEAG